MEIYSRFTERQGTGLLRIPATKFLLYGTDFGIPLRQGGRYDGRTFVILEEREGGRMYTDLLMSGGSHWLSSLPPLPSTGRILLEENRALAGTDWTQGPIQTHSPVLSGQARSSPAYFMSK